MQAANRQSIAIPIASVRNAKLGALYFDQIVPILCDDVPKELSPPEFESWTSIRSTAVVDMMRGPDIRKRVTLAIPRENGQEEQYAITDDNGEIDFDRLEFANQFVFANHETLPARLSSAFKDVGLASAPLLLTQGFADRTRKVEALPEIEATLAGLEIVDVDNVSWEEILEFRKDLKSREGLRRLRLYLTKEYVGKTRDQIEAGILLAIEDQRRAAKTSGFRLTFTTMRSVCNAKTALTVGGVGAVAEVLSGNATGLTMGLAAGATLEFAGLVLSVVEAARDLRELHKNHPLWYVMEAGSRLSGKN